MVALEPVELTCFRRVPPGWSVVALRGEHGLPTEYLGWGLTRPVPTRPTLEVGRRQSRVCEAGVHLLC